MTETSAAAILLRTICSTTIIQRPGARFAWLLRPFALALCQVRAHFQFVKSQNRAAQALLLLRSAGASSGFLHPGREEKGWGKARLDAEVRHPPNWAPRQNSRDGVETSRA